MIFALMIKPQKQIIFKCRIFHPFHPFSMGGNNSECLAELNDYLHEEYEAKKGQLPVFCPCCDSIAVWKPEFLLFN